MSRCCRYIYTYIGIYIYISEHKKNAHNDGNEALSLILETLLLAIEMCTGFTTDVIWVNTKMYSFTSEPTQSSGRRVSSISPTKKLSGELLSEVLLIARSQDPFSPDVYITYI